MNYKLKNVNGKVTFLLKTGGDFVKNQMAVASAQHIINNGTLKESDRPGYPINVDDMWYFEGEPFGGGKPGKRGTHRENEV